MRAFFTILLVGCLLTTAAACTSCSDLPSEMTGFQCNSYQASECSSTTITCNYGVSFTCSDAASDIGTYIGVAVAILVISAICRHCRNKRAAQAQNVGTPYVVMPGGGANPMGGGLSVPVTAACSNCGAPSTGAAFCANCGSSA
jgi:hypothetical protein